ncbi:hypothetical protein Ari01nite_17490 [Paractinoplanes rishiriensis]|uniref:Uncharacterized protein n=1 Tax=Paractinoplanes rishiriensis TaxID=1050105 RepID=A0A919MTH8_9ACTN|nr:hypothetical protein Ari01nite_17490 [Actinoplanes rishiriensis]
MTAQTDDIRSEEWQNALPDATVPQNRRQFPRCDSWNAWKIGGAFNSRSGRCWRTARSEPFPAGSAARPECDDRNRAPAARATSTAHPRSPLPVPGGGPNLPSLVRTPQELSLP